MIPARVPQGEPGAVLPHDLHAIITAASPAVRHGAVFLEVDVRERGYDGGMEANVTAASLLILVPWLVFAAGLVAIGLRLMLIRRDRRRR
jgi:hypothetical protein